MALPELIRARVSVMGGDERDGLEAYSRTDPQDWRTIDVRLFWQLDLHAGLQSETRSLLKAAISGQRVPENLRSDIVRIVYPKPIEQTQEQQLDMLRKKLEADPALASRIGKASGELLNIQKLFLEQAYGEILQQYADADPLDQADRLVIIVFLSAIKERDSEQVVRWSQELYRRYPTWEMKQWIESIRKQSTLSP